MYQASIIDLTRPGYWVWLTKATDALASYLIGEIPEEEAIAIICVPKKEDVLEKISAEYTLANSGTQC